MTPFSITRHDESGFECTSIHNGLIELSILQELGGKINSLRDSRTGREWLWKHPRLAYQRVPYGSSYVKYADTGGWDECFPSVAECEYPTAPWQGAAIQDHGELWSQVAKFDLDENENTVTLRFRWQGVALPYIFNRLVTLTANSSKIHVDYEVENNVGQPIDFVWCIHPLLAIEPGMELLLPSAAQFNVGGTSPQDLFDAGQKLKYPFNVSGVKFPTLPEASAAVAIKLWSDALALGDGWATLRARDGELRMSWDVTMLPQVAAWLNLGAWAADGGAPYFNLGLEPCIGAQDSLADAVIDHKLFATIAPHDSKTWWLDIELKA